jgi:phage baseplate assembly protein W
MPEPRAFLGTGWKFPLQVTPQGGIALARAETRIEESIYLILSTAEGERVMLPEFGCAIHDRVFDPSNPASVALIVDGVREALVENEARIDVLSVAADPTPETPNLLVIRVTYRIRASNVTGNLVYPFYLTEGR